MKRITPFHLCIFALPAICLSCAKSGTTIGKNTPPEAITQAKSPEVHSSMRQLAYQVDALNLALKMKTDTKSFQKDEVLKHLNDLETTAESMKGKNIQHPMFEAYLRVFVTDIQRAQAGASQPNPNFYYAGKITGSCQYCHKPDEPSEPFSWQDNEIDTRH